MNFNPTYFSCFLMPAISHYTRESCLDPKHVNRVWKLEELNPRLVWTVEAGEHCCGQAMR